MRMQNDTNRRLMSAAFLFITLAAATSMSLLGAPGWAVWTVGSMGVMIWAIWARGFPQILNAPQYLWLVCTDKINWQRTATKGRTGSEHNPGNPVRNPTNLDTNQHLIIQAANRLRQRGSTEFHISQMAMEIDDHSDNPLMTAYGTVYRDLENLLHRGILTARWEDPSHAEQEERPVRRFYTLTDRN